MAGLLSSYLRHFTHLRTDRTGGWTATTRGQAPHKPLLLLAVMDLFAEGRIVANLIEVNPELGELFAAYWRRVMPPERRGNLALPFFHLRSSGFWRLLPRPGQEVALEAADRVDSLSRLQKLVLGAQLDEPLYQLLQVPKERDALRTAVIQAYFAPDLHATLLEQGQSNLQSFIYSQRLIEGARRQAKESPDKEQTYDTVRDQGFRRAIVRIYENRCAFCGLRMLTAEGRTVVDAAHIIPWSISHDDDPHNGMALCRLCHWTFDQGLMSVSARYRSLVSNEMRAAQNLPGHLLTLENRGLLGPAEHELWPSLEALAWHQKTGSVPHSQ